MVPTATRLHNVGFSHSTSNLDYQKAMWTGCWQMPEGTWTQMTSRSLSRQVSAHQCSIRRTGINRVTFFQGNGLFCECSLPNSSLTAQLVLWAGMADRHTVTSVSYGLTFFSDSRLQSLSARLRNDKLHDLTHRISLVLQVRAKPTESVSTGSLNRKRENPTTLYDSEKASKWIQSMFK